MVNSKTEATSVGHASLLSIEKRTAFKNLFIALFAAITTSNIAFAQSNTVLQRPTSENLFNGASDQVWLNGTNELCWRSDFWTPATANIRCDGAVIARFPASSKFLSSQKLTYQAETLFDFDKATLKIEGRSQLNVLIEKVKNSKVEVFVVTGHSDKVGTDQYNLNLSNRRAEAVKHYLSSKGLDSQRIFTEAKGKSEPLTQGCTQIKAGKASQDQEYINCLSPDRRVVVEVIASRN